MKQRNRKRKCKHCRALFYPDHRNTKRQKFCSKPQCRKASKSASQRKWLERPKNKDYFKGLYHVQRVQFWRNNHPGYWHKAQDKEKALQDSLTPYLEEAQEVTKNLDEIALQDILMSQDAVFIGLIAQLTGSTLQDNIALTAQRMRQLGNDIINRKPLSQGGSYDDKTPNMSQPNQKDSRSVQLDRSPFGS
ncbi:MAG: hypothetical protein ACYSUB_21575 [Planctomycetota bacterium]|jgi:hypothetical protein